MKNYEVFTFVDECQLPELSNIQGIKFEVDDEVNNIYYVSYTGNDYLDSFSLMEEMKNLGINFYYEDENNKIYEVEEFEKEFLKDFIKELEENN